MVENPSRVVSRRGLQNIRPGTPVRALGDHIPKTSGETYLKKGQATSYVRPGPRNWALVRHATGEQGYVPATHLSLYIFLTFSKIYLKSMNFYVFFCYDFFF